MIFIGRPETNSALANCQPQIGLKCDGAISNADGKEHTAENEALVWAAAIRSSLNI